MIPTDVAGLQGWWEAGAGVYKDAGITLAADGETVQQWNDQSGATRNFSQATATNRPTYRTNIVNGLPVVRFDGVDNYMDTVATIAAFMAVGAATVFAVVYVTTISTNGANPYDNDSVWADSQGGINPRVAMFCRTAPLVGAYGYDGAVKSATKATNPTGSWHIMTWHHEGGNLYFGLTDTRTASMASAALGDLASTAGVLRMAANYNAVQFLAVDIAEIFVYNVAVDESDRMGLEIYAAGKYGITLPYGSMSLILFL